MPDPAHLEPLGFSIRDAVDASGLGRTKLFEAIQTGALEARKYGRRTIITRDALKRFLDGLPARTPSRIAARDEVTA